MIIKKITYIFISFSLLAFFVLEVKADKISVKKQEGSATNTATYLIDRYKVYTFDSEHKEQATCQEWKEDVANAWTRIIAKNGVLVTSSGRCADIVLGEVKLGGVKSDNTSADIIALKREIAELKNTQGIILRLINIVIEFLGRLNLLKA